MEQIIWFLQNVAEASISATRKLPIVCQNHHTEATNGMLEPSFDQELDTILNYELIIPLWHWKKENKYDRVKVTETIKVSTEPTGTNWSVLTRTMSFCVAGKTSTYLNPPKRENGWF